MERSRRDVLISGLALAACSGTPPAGGLDVRPTGAEPRNVVLILTDDQRWDMLGCAGNPIIQTPNVDALARRGVTYTRAWSNACTRSSAPASVRPA